MPQRQEISTLSPAAQEAMDEVTRMFDIAAEEFESKVDAIIRSDTIQ